MERFLLSQYANKKNMIPNNNSPNKKRDKNKQNDDAKSEDKGDNITYTSGAHVGEAASDKDETFASTNTSSIGAQGSDVTKTVVTLTQCVHDILVEHPINDPIQDCINSCDILIDTVNSTEGMTGANVVGQEYQGY